MEGQQFYCKYNRYADKDDTWSRKNLVTCPNLAGRITKVEGVSAVQKM